jgi:hypothetical protein
VPVNPFIIASKRRKYFGINFSSKVKNLYTVSFQILLKEIEEDKNKWEDIMFMDWETLC